MDSPDQGAVGIALDSIAFAGGVLRCKAPRISGVYEGKLDPASRTIVVPHAGHGALQLGCTARVAQQFVERGTADGLDTRCVARYTPPPFVVVR